jgi:predicted kinase
VTSPILVVTGPPGAGKSTVARMIAASSTDPSVHLHADDFWRHVVGGYIEPWLPEARHQNDAVTRAVFAAMVSFWSDGYAVVLDGVFGPWVAETLKAAVPSAAGVDYVILRPSLTVVTERVESRVGHELKDMAAVTHMHGQFTMIEPMYERHVLDTSTRTPAEIVAAVQDGRTRGIFRLA